MEAEKSGHGRIAVAAWVERDRLIDDGYLLAQDLAPILGRASEHWDYLMEAGTTQP